VSPEQERLMGELTAHLVAYGLNEEAGLIYEVGRRVVEKFDPAKSPSFIGFVLSTYRFRKIDLYRLSTHRGRDKRVHVQLEGWDQSSHEPRDWSIPEVPQVLNHREAAVWRMVAGGLTRGQIAQRIGRSESGVSLHLQRIERKVAGMYDRLPRKSRKR